ncbi:hypothetical protein Poly24_32160 [Rosistilla carotiformis]|uniref:DUF2062 domain-containing protein n=1 Tax=Rosistilla carotiformis TaxID=2528017 RepID=A0A518JVC6_9BACT|nr:TIGR03546 family protein [Rosistilla carotiformis]QDV69500.1 hypothetical protein Poly24_32160 [Rosistilla carotiformis]
MIIWLYRQIQGVRKALAGRDNPEELAWAMALGVLLGVVPKGNLTAVMLVFLVLILRVNHAMAAVTAVAVSFAAVLLDPFTHQMGQWVLEQPALQSLYTWSWQQPLIPWTDLNNTVVMGSLLFGLMMLFPTYSLTLPMFRAIATRPSEATEDRKRQQETKTPIVATEAPEAAPIAAKPKPQVDVIRVRRDERSEPKPVAIGNSDAPRREAPQVKKQEKAA